jgi:hypothetical protein
MLNKKILGKLYSIEYKLMLVTNNENQSIFIESFISFTSHRA